MESTSRQSFDPELDQINQQDQPYGLEDTLRSDHSSMMDSSKHGIFVERTLALIKPDAVQKANEIETIILKHGFTVLQVSEHSLRCSPSCLAFV
jgi:Nucleoside diphosphate kinase